MSSQASTKPPLVVWGASGHALVVADIVRLAGIYEIVGFLDDIHLDAWGSRFAGSRILGGRAQLQTLRANGVLYLIVAIGDCSVRLRLARIAIEVGFELVQAVHPRSVVASDAIIGRGTVICAGAVVNPQASVGQNVIVNTCASVDHECVLEDGVHVGPGAHIAGKVFVGQGAMIGAGATVIDHCSIGARAVIGAGAVVVGDIPENVIAVGVPARPMKLAPEKG